METAPLLAGAVVSLAGVIVWAVRFFLNKMFGRNGQEGAWGKLLDKIDTIKDSITELSQDQRAVLEKLQQLHDRIEP